MTQPSVFNRSDFSVQEISPSLYNLVIGLCLSWGFGINWLMVKHIPTENILALNPLLLIIGYLVSCFFGVFLSAKSDNPIISFIGYNFIVLPLGLIINLAVSNVSPTLVAQAIQTTGGVTFLMMGLGSLFPVFFKKIAGTLFISLIVVIIVEAVQALFFHQHSGIIDWVVAAIFCGYIGYDWGRANQIPKTIDNAVDSAVALYVDIINLFLRILRILSRD
jgi:FtsH-binding integral membrane protein